MHDLYRFDPSSVELIPYSCGALSSWHKVKGDLFNFTRDHNAGGHNEDGYDGDRSDFDGGGFGRDIGGGGCVGHGIFLGRARDLGEERVE